MKNFAYYSDSQLIQAHKDSMDELIVRYKRLVYYFARKIALDPDEIDELANAGFEGFLKSIEKYKPELGEFKPFGIEWIKKSIISERYKQHRNDKREISISSLQESAVDFPSESKPLIELLKDKEFRNVIRKAIMKLDAIGAVVIYSYYFNDAKFVDIARALNVDRSRVCQCHTAALNKLHLLLKDYFEERIK